MRISLISLLILFSAMCIAESNIYRQIDKQGNVSYTNINSGGAKKIELPFLTVIPAIDTSAVNPKIKKRMKAIRMRVQRGAVEQKIAEETHRIEEIKRMTNREVPGVLDIESGYHGFLDNYRPKEIQNELRKREENLNALQHKLESLFF